MCLVVCFCFPFALKAQEQRIYSQFFMNPFVYNPAYAGVEGHTVFYAMYRNQWPGISETPQISNFNFHTPMKGGIGFGAEVLNDTKAGVLKTSEFKIAGSYLATFDNKHYLRFGLSVGAGSSGLDLDEVSRLDINDQNLLNTSVDQSTYLTGSFGATYHTGHFNIGFSLPSIIDSAPVAFESFQSPGVDPLDNILIKANYRGHIGDKIAIEPHLLYRYNNYGTSQLEATTILHLLHIVWIGASYAQDAGPTGYLGLKVKDKFAVGAAYNPGKQGVSSFTGNVLEIKIGYHLGSRKKHAEHVSSFIKSHRKTLEERQAEAEKKEQEKLLAEEKALEAEEKRQQEIEQRRLEVEQRAADRLAAELELEKGQAETTKPEEEIVEEVPAVVVIETPTEPVKESKTEVRNEKPEKSTKETSIAKSYGQPEKLDVPLRVKKGNHMLELSKGNYVIAGAFKVFENAERFSDDLFLSGYHDNKVGYISETQFYYVVVNSFDTVKDAGKSKNKLRKVKNFENTWVLIVE